MVRNLPEQQPQREEEARQPPQQQQLRRLAKPLAGRLHSRQPPGCNSNPPGTLLMLTQPLEIAEPLEGAAAPQKEPKSQHPTTKSAPSLA